MKALTFWFDPISPYAYLAFQRLPQALEGCSYAVEYRPVLLAGVLNHWGQKGPAEIAPKREWTYRQVLWLAHRDGVALQFPAAHPFNPLTLLRLLWACAPTGGAPNRWQCETVLRHVWQGGAAADDATRLTNLQTRLAPSRDVGDAAVKTDLRAATDAAIAAGVFGVPTIALEGRLFWGLDALEMVAAALRGEAGFDGPDWDTAAQLPVGAQRR